MWLNGMGIWQLGEYVTYRFYVTKIAIGTQIPGNWRCLPNWPKGRCWTSIKRQVLWQIKSVESAHFSHQ